MNLEVGIKENYNLNIINITKNEDSTEKNVYNIETLDNKYIVKIYDDLDKAQNMVDLHTYLEALYIPEIIKTKDKKNLCEIDNKYIIMYSFLQGKQLNIYLKENDKYFSNDIVKKIAKELRKLHDLTLNNSFNLKSIDFINKLDRKSVLHFDLTKENIFINDGKVGFIDFDDAKYGDSVCDIAIIISFLFISKKRGLDKENIKVFLDNYYLKNEDELKKKELSYIKKYIIEWVDYILDGHEFDSSTKDSFEFKKSIIQNDNINLF